MALGFADFANDLTYDGIPAAVRTLLRRSFVDTMGVAAIGSTTEISAITRRYADTMWRAAPEIGAARMLFDGRPVSPAGAAFAGAFTIDSIDAHDGYSACKGHAGSAVFPGVLATFDALRDGGSAVDGRDLMVALAIAYETSYRAGLTLHATASDYHTSGAWTAVGVATAAARLFGLAPEQVRHAAGIAEYHGPRSQMMRCIDHPTMLRDGVGWGAPTGVTAACMAQLGFTGAPAITAEGEAAAPWWADLGRRWEILETHYKPYPVCRWAHPAVDAARALMADHGLDSGDVESVVIQTFHYATRLAGQEPKTLDELTYAIAFPVAMMIVRGQIGVEELQPETLRDPEILRVSRATTLVDSDHYTKISTRKRWADVTLHLNDGRTLQSEPRFAKGDPDDPLSDIELSAKYDSLAVPVLGPERAAEIQSLGAAFDSLSASDFSRLLTLILSATPSG